MCASASTQDNLEAAIVAALLQLRGRAGGVAHERSVETGRTTAMAESRVWQTPSALDALKSALEFLPLAAALTGSSGELLGANRALMDILGVSGDPRLPNIRLPLPQDYASSGGDGAPEVRVGRIWLTRRDGLIELQVVVVSAGAEGRLFYLVTNAHLREEEGVLARREEALRWDEERRRLACLTFREAQVLRLLITDGSNKAVARQLGISPRTVEVHRGRLLRKLDARSLSQAIAIAMAAGFDAQPGHGEARAESRPWRPPPRYGHLCPR